MLELNLCNEFDFVDATVLREPKTYPVYFDTYKDFNELVLRLNFINNLF